MHLHRLLAMSVSAAVVAACSRGAADQPPADKSPPQVTQPAAMPEHLCDLLPQADAQRVMSKALVQKRNDDSGCRYEDAAGTTGTSLFVFLNALPVGDQCRLTRGSEPLSGVGTEACLATRQPDGLYTTVVFGSGGRTFEVVAPGQDRASELATATAKVILSKLGS
jgi:hypothetical protein